ncbi:hypothetical protein CMV_027272, partial [Castanea mollissima]
GKCHYCTELQWDDSRSPTHQGKSIKDTCEAASYSPNIALTNRHCPKHTDGIGSTSQLRETCVEGVVKL